MIFRTIKYSKMTFETLRSYFSVNASGQLSILYKFVFSCLYPLQSVFDNYDTFRIKKQIIASCKWQIGQLTNVLNYFFDPTLKRIHINQSEVTIIAESIDLIREIQALAFPQTVGCLAMIV